MLTKENVFELSRRGFHLLANTKGNNGRELRRYVAAVAGVGNRVVQVFATGADFLSEFQTKLHGAYAEQVRAASSELLDDRVAASATTTTDLVFGLVHNTYRLWDEFDVTNASVKELRWAAWQIVMLCDSMRAFAGNPTRELQTTLASQLGDVIKSDSQASMMTALETQFQKVCAAGSAPQSLTA